MDDWQFDKHPTNKIKKTAYYEDEHNIILKKHKQAILDRNIGSMAQMIINKIHKCEQYA